MKRSLDSIDRRILKELQQDGRIPIVELANRVHLTKTPCTERVRRLEKSGYITGYRADLSPVELGCATVVIVHVTLGKTSSHAIEEFNNAVAAIPEIQSAYLIAGHFDYMLKVRARDVNHYRTVLGERIGNLPGVQQTHSFVAIELVKDTHVLHV